MERLDKKRIESHRFLQGLDLLGGILLSLAEPKPSVGLVIRSPGLRRQCVRQEYQLNNNQEDAPHLTPHGCGILRLHFLRHK
jgi:hypothetical protein